MATRQPNCQREFVAWRTTAQEANSIACGIEPRASQDDRTESEPENEVREWGIKNCGWQDEGADGEPSQQAKQVQSDGPENVASSSERAALLQWHKTAQVELAFRTEGAFDELRMLEGRTTERNKSSSPVLATATARDEKV